MPIIKNSFILNSLHDGKKILCDSRYVSTGSPKPIILFIHGFKGFKDWGHFNLLANRFTENGFVYVKLNLSHNGTTPENPFDFADLEAFGNNNYTIELDDIKVVLDYLEGKDFDIPSTEANAKDVFLIGHSRGGGISIIKASEDARIKKLVTWASVSRLRNMVSGDALEEWKEKGVTYIYNSRTKQNMPLYYQLVENYLSNEERFSVVKNVARLNIPYLNIHGDQDETVNVSVVQELKTACKTMTSHIVKGGNHVFGASHPFVEKVLPQDAEEVFEVTLNFLKQ